jgi:L-threonylcarbamoyladenylate synthase
MVSIGTALQVNLQDQAAASHVRGRVSPAASPFRRGCPALAGGHAVIARSWHEPRQLDNRLPPGGLTLVLPRRDPSALALLVGAGLNTVDVRCPAHPVAREELHSCAATLRLGKAPAAVQQSHGREVP